MLYRKLAWVDVNTLADYLGIERSEFSGKGWIRKRICPDCATCDHADHYEVINGAIVRLSTTSAYCQANFEGCPRCTHGTECQEYDEGIFVREFVDRNRNIKRFISSREFAFQIGAHPTTVRGWIRTGKIGKREGAIRGQYTDMIDTEKLPLLKKFVQGRRLRSAA
jgi:hypothetical protein